MNCTSWRAAIRAPLIRPTSALKIRQRRLLSTKPDDLAPGTSQKARSRIERITSRLPARLQRYTTPLLNAPLTHITAFLLLHELTAVVPIFGLAGLFHYTRWMPPFVGEGKWVADGVEKFGNWFRRKGWFGKEEEKGWRARWWGRGEGGTRVVVELATAYAVTKALLPLRLVFSVWATPWFARVAIVPTTNAFKKVFGRKPK